MQFTQGALSNKELADYLNENFVCTFKQVSTFTVTNRKYKWRDRWGNENERDSTRKNGGNVASYFCNPDREVLSLVVGPVAPKRVWISGELARDLHAKTSNLNPEEQAVLARKFHKKLAGEKSMRLFDEQNKNNSWDGEKYRGRSVAVEAERAAHATFFAAKRLRKIKHTWASANPDSDVFPADFTTYGSNAG